MADVRRISLIEDSLLAVRTARPQRWGHSSKRGNVRSGSEADLTAPRCDFHYAPESRHSQGMFKLKRPVLHIPA